MKTYKVTIPSSPAWLVASSAVTTHHIITTVTMKVRILIQFLVSLRLAGETLPCGGEEAGLQEYQVLRIEAGCVRCGTLYFIWIVDNVMKQKLTKI